LVNWVTNVETSFNALKGNPKALQTAFDNQVQSLTDLIKMVQGDLDRQLRQKIMCMITMDAHSRDIIDKLIKEKVTVSEEF
jgi:dynein heavy chain